MGIFSIHVLCDEGTVFTRQLEIPLDILTRMSFDDIDYYIEEDINSLYSGISNISWERVDL